MKKLLLSVLLVLGIVGMAEAQVSTVGANCTIRWTANTESDLAGYRVYGTQGGITNTLDVVSPVVTTTCAALGTQAGGPLSVQVDAVDLSGNRSVRSAAVTVNQDIAGPAQPSGLSVTPNP